ncbi:hypothetical protein N9D23_05205 [Rubripirellula sp.]|nr:hypothetical protein [Rubripirellula sp.]
MVGFLLAFHSGQETLPVPDVGLRDQKELAPMLAPMLAPKPGNSGQMESLPDHLADDSGDDAETKKARKTLGFTSFNAVGATRFELATSTSRTKWHGDENTANCGINRDASELMHLWMHQIAELDERLLASMLVDSIEESVGPDGVEQVIDALRRRVESAFPSKRRVKSDV